MKHGFKINSLAGLEYNVKIKYFWESTNILYPIFFS